MSSTNKKTLKRKPSYMMDGSPHRHMKSYDEEWVHEPLDRISHLSADSIAFALNLRPEDKRQVQFSPMKKAAPLHQQSSGPCTSKGCKRNTAAIKAYRKKNAEIREAVKNMKQELVIVEEERNKVEATYDACKAVLEQSNTELYDLKLAERKSNFPDRLEIIEKDNSILRNEVRQRQEIILKLKRDVINRELPRRALFPQEVHPSFANTNIVTSTDTEDNNISCEELDNKRYYHTGTFIRSARTNWDPCWTCCMATDENSRGCRKRAKTEMVKYSNFVRSKSEKYIKTVDQWMKTRKEERPSIRDFRQWSSPTLKPTASIKAFAMNRLHKIDHPSNKFPARAAPREIYT